jgi:hypothetical protein
MRPQRHRWGEKIRTERETLQICTRNGCGVSKITHHEAERWTDYHRQGVKISDNAPVCEGEA